MNKKIRWFGTVLYFIGMALTSANVHPVNLVFMTAGAGFWCAAGWAVDDAPLVLVEGMAFLIYGTGLVVAAVKIVMIFL